MINNHIIKFIKFGSVGVSTAAIYFLTMWLLQSVLFYEYMVSISLAYFFSTIFHFLMNRKFTFSASEDAGWGQFRRYVVIWIVNYFATILIVKFSVEMLLLSPYLGVCISVFFTSVIGYLLGHCWVFKIKRQC